MPISTDAGYKLMNFKIPVPLYKVLKITAMDRNVNMTQVIIGYLEMLGNRSYAGGETVLKRIRKEERNERLAKKNSRTVVRGNEDDKREEHS